MMSLTCQQALHECSYGGRRCRAVVQQTDLRMLTARQPRRDRCTRHIVYRAQGDLEPLVPDNINIDDPELQSQIKALLQDLDPDLLLDDTEQLITGIEAAAAASQAKQQAAHGAGAAQHQQDMQAAAEVQAGAWQEGDGDEDTEAGLPEGLVLTRAEYKRKASVLVELMAALQSEGAEEALAQKLSAFRLEIDEALIHMLGKRIQAAQTHEQDMLETSQLQELYGLLQYEYERAQATPAMRLLDEVLDMLGDDPYLPGARERGAAVVQRLRKAFTGGVVEDVDVFAAAAALAADKALAAEALAVEYVPLASFLSEGMELLQSAKDEMEQLALAVTQAQGELQQVRNNQPDLLATPQAQAHLQQITAAEEVLQRRKAAVTQLSYVLNVAQDLEAAERSLQADSLQEELGGLDALMMPEQLAALLGDDAERRQM